MERKKRTRALIEGDRAVLERIACEIQQDHEVRVVREPAGELVMLKVREGARRTQFYLGEALVTSCAVAIDETYGYGMVMGDDEQCAYELALVDAAFSLGADRCSEWGVLIQEQEKLVEEQRRRRRCETALTRVDFSTMEG